MIAVLPRSRTFLFIVAVLAASSVLNRKATFGGVSAFVSQPFYCRHPSVHKQTRSTARCMATTRADVSVPSQSQCESLGVREWPQQSKSGSWSEPVSPDKSVARYVLEGSGSLTIQEIGSVPQPVSLRPGTLIQIQQGDPSVQLEWSCDDNCPEIILLTPGFEEGGVFFGVLAGIFVLFGVLLSGVLG